MICYRETRCENEEMPNKEQGVAPTLRYLAHVQINTLLDDYLVYENPQYVP